MEEALQQFFANAKTKKMMNNSIEE